MLSALPPAYDGTTPITLDIWPGNAPGETTSSTGTSEDDASWNFGKITRVSDVTRPQLFWYPAPGPKHLRPTVMICPGGGYWILASDIEGSEVAEWINSLGYNAAVLHYRIPERRDGALQDAQRALSLLHAHADALGIDTENFGIFGFSAGGHLSARTSCATSRAYDAVDETDQFSCRPDFTVLIYPAYLWDKDTEQTPDEVLPHADMPPIFLVQTRDDGICNAEHYASVLKSAGVVVETAIYDEGGHGYGLRLNESLPAHQWPNEVAAWLKQKAVK